MKNSGCAAKKGRSMKFLSLFFVFLFSSLAAFVSEASEAQLYLRITEIMFNPAPPVTGTNVSSDFEFIEFANTSSNITLD